MQVTVLHYEPNQKGLRLGFVDIKVIHSADKWEIFRGLSFVQKDNQRWIALPNTKRKEQWLPTYERNPPLSKDIFAQALKALDQYLINLQPSALADDQPEPTTDLF